jgi:hypothetical protein
MEFFMSAKDDQDNRSNQLNPNNPVYASSRRGVASFDDDDADLDECFQATNFYVKQRRTLRKSGEYGVGFVDQAGRARFFTFTLEATRDDFFYGAEQGLSHDLERYFEVFATHLRGLIYRHLKGHPALYCWFDGSESCLPWHVPLEPENPERMRESLISKNLEAQTGFDATKHVEALRAVLRPPYEDWGVFTVENRGISTLKFTYDARCTAALQVKTFS